MVESLEEIRLGNSFAGMYLAMLEGNVRRVHDRIRNIENQILIRNGMPKEQKAAIKEILEQAGNEVYAPGVGFTLERALEQAERGHLLSMTRATIQEARQYADKSKQEFPYDKLHMIHLTLYRRAENEAERWKHDAEENQRESGMRIWQRYLKELPQKRLQDALTYVTWAVQDKKFGEAAYWLKDVYSTIMKSFEKLGAYKLAKRAA